MSRKLIYLAALSLVCGTALADSPRLKLKITAPIGASNGSHCVDDSPQALSPATKLTLTEKDVSHWNPVTSTWTLDPSRFAGNKAGWQLADHCYELLIDGKLVSKGLVLWTHSPRLTGFPTLIVTDVNASLNLQLLSGNHGSNVRLIHTDELNSVLGTNTR